MNHWWSRRPGRRAAALATPVSLLLVLGLGAGAAAGGPTRDGPRAADVAPVAETVSTSAQPSVRPDPNRARITLTAVAPTVVTPQDSVTIRGTITAPASGPLTGPQLRIILGDADLSQRTSIDAWSAGTSAADGRSLLSMRIGNVAAGATAPFIATIESGRVRSAEPVAALPISLEVVQEGASTPTGVTRTYLAWQERKEYVPLEVATVLPVTLDPELDLFTRTTAARERAWREVIGPDSRIRRIVDGTKGTPVTLAVDPSVFGPDAGAGTSSATGSTPTPSGTASGTATNGATATPGPTVTTSAPSPAPTGTPTPTPTPTDGAAVPTSTVDELSDALAAELRGRSVWALPYADADLAATVSLDPTNALIRDLVDRSSLVSDVLGQPTRRDIVWPVDGLLPSGREKGMATIFAGTRVKKPAGMIVNQLAVTRAAAYTPTARRVTASKTRLLAYDPRLSALLPRRSDETAVLSTQRFLAETLVLLRERPGTARSVLVTAPRTYDPDPRELASFLARTGGVPWIRTVDAASLLTDPGSDKAMAAQTPVKPVASAAPPPVLTRARLTQMAAQREILHRVASVLEDGEAFEQTYRELLDELASVRWRYEPESWTALNDLVVEDTKAATSAIRVVGRSVNFLAERGTLQITVENGLDYTVDDIRLRLEPTNPRIRVVEQPGPITIGPASKTNVPVAIQAVAAGRADIRAYLTTADGTPIGRPAVIPVVANPIDGTIYWVGGVLVALVLLFGVARTLRKGTSRIDEIGDIGLLEADADVERDDAG